MDVPHEEIRKKQSLMDCLAIVCQFVRDQLLPPQQYVAHNSSLTMQGDIFWLIVSLFSYPTA